MLYMTTRSKTDTYTAHRVIHDTIPNEQGQVLPMKLPKLTEEEINDILSKPFCDVVSQILSIFFPEKVTAWDISCLTGKGVVRIDPMGQKVYFAALWDNQQRSMEALIQAIYAKLCADFSCGKASGFARIAIHIALIFGAYSQLRKQGREVLDFAATAEDFEVVFSAWYARQMGLPIGTILCTCNENSNVWDFLHRGSLNTGAQVISTAYMRLNNQLPRYLESVIYCALGRQACNDYVTAVQDAGVYALDEEQLACVNSGVYVCVVGGGRSADVISSVFSTERYILDPYSAMVYGGLQDYRARTGQNNYTLLWSKDCPEQYSKEVSGALGFDKNELLRLLNRA